ncbi:MAG: helix-turn-helix domain-containing protein [Kiritimatiellia bacterium]|jgi:excisionase family DNA binding protein
MTKKTKSKISPQTRAAVAAILDADNGLSPAHRLAILTACDTPPDAAPGPAPGVEIPAQDAARILGKSLPTVLRWIASGKLEGRQFGNRLWLVSAASVEAVRASMAAPSAPIPDRLAHLADLAPRGRGRTK